MRDFVWMIRRHRDDILNYFKILINNGAVDTSNNKAKAMGKLPEPQLTHKLI
jgi:transposase